jgi:2'-5' RNA ligase
VSVPAFHLWLTPSGPSRVVLAAIIRRLARELEAPVFEPHVTLLTDLPGSAHQQQQRATALAARLRPTRLTLTEPGYADGFFHCVFMRVELTPDVARLRAVAEEVFGRPPQPYMPHLSLVYGSYPAARKQAIIRQIPAEAETSFVADALHLIRADSPSPPDWAEIGAFPFRPGG